MTPDPYADIEARLAAATPGEWALYRYANGTGRIHVGESTLVADTYQAEDRELIAHAPADLRRLLDRVLELEALRVADVRAIMLAWESARWRERGMWDDYQQEFAEGWIAAHEITTE